MNSNDNLDICLRVFRKSEILEKSDFDDSFKEQYNNYLNIEDRDSEEVLSSFTSSVSHVIIRKQVTSLKYEPELTGSKNPIKRLPSEKYDKVHQESSVESSLKTDSLSVASEEIIINNETQGKFEKNQSLKESDNLNEERNIFRKSQNKNTETATANHTPNTKTYKESCFISIPTEPEISDNFKKNNSNLMFACKVYEFSDLSKMLNKFDHIENSLWDPTSFCEKLKFSLCKCFKKQIELDLSTEQEVFLLITLSETYFDLTNTFHTSLLYNYYQRLTLHENFENSPESWRKMGFSNSNPKENELNNKMILISLMFLVFIIENKPKLFQAFYKKGKKYKCGFMRVSILIMMESVGLLRKKIVNEIFLDHDGVTQRFFEFHGGMVAFWIKSINGSSFDKSVNEMLKKGMKSITRSRDEFIHFT